MEEPQPLTTFLIIHLILLPIVILNNTDLQLSFRITAGHISDHIRTIAKIQITPGLSSHRGRFRDHIGTRTNDNHVNFIIHNYCTVSGLDLNKY